MKFFIILIFPFLLGCKLVDKPEKAPSFIRIENFNFHITSSGQQGSQSNKITDVWVYVSGNLEGVYELPATIPLHHEGSKNLSLYPGIKRNGIAADRKIYPFYKRIDTTINLIPDSVIELQLNTEYEENLSFTIEDFDSPNTIFTSNDSVSFISLEHNQENLFEGDAGAINMDENDVFFEMRTNDDNFDNFPRNLNIPAYIELDYANNYPFEIGILHRDNSLPTYLKQALITMNPTSEIDSSSLIWNKTYLYIPDATNFFPSATKFDLYLSVSNFNEVNNIKIRLDNFKVIFREP